MGGRVRRGWGEGAERGEGRYESSALKPLTLAAHRENDSLQLLVARRDGGRETEMEMKGIWKWTAAG